MLGLTTPRPDEATALRLGRLERLQRLTAALSAALTPEQVGRAIFEEGLVAAGAKAGNLFWEDEAGTLRLVLAYGLPAKYEARVRVATPDIHIPSVDAWRTGQPVWIHDPAGIAAAYPEHADMAAETGDGAWVGLPLAVDRPRGGLGFRFDGPRAFDGEEKAYLLAVSHHCAQALERARLYEAQRAQTERLTALQRATSALSAAATPREVAAVVFRELLRLGAAEAVIMRRTADDHLEVVASHGNDEATLARLAHLPLETAAPVSDAARSGEVIWLDRPDAILARYPRLAADLARRGDGAWVAAPLTVEGRSTGALAFTAPPGTPLRPDDRGLVVALALQCAQALERARHFEAEARLSRRLSGMHAAVAALSGAVTAGEVAEATGQALELLGATVVELYALAGPERIVRAGAAGHACGGPTPPPILLEADHPVAEVARSGKALWLDDAAAFSARWPHLDADRAAAGIASCGLVPLLAGGRTLGVLLVGFDVPHAVAPEDRGYVRLVALPTAHALDRAVWRHPTPAGVKAVTP
jgi:GAF domain-containing protein